VGDLMAYQVSELPPVLPGSRPWFDPAQGTIVTEFQAGHGFTTSGADASSNVNDTTAGLPIIGIQCATVVSAGTGASAILQKTSITTADTTSLQAAVILKCDDTTHLSSLTFSIGNGNAFVNEYHVQIGTQVLLSSGAWQVITLSLGDAVSQGSPTRTGINAIRVFHKDDNTGNKVTVHYQGLYWMPNASAQTGSPFPNGVCSVTFDDNFASQWNIAKPYLDSYGYRASAYLIRDTIGGTGRMTLAQAQSCQNQAGWEVNSHAYTDADHGATLPALSSAQLYWDLSAEKEWLFANGLQGQGYAYPKGAASPAVATVVQNFYRYARGTQQLTETYPPGDAYRLKGVSSIGEFTGGLAPSLISGSGGKIDQAVSNASWLMLTFHNIIPAVTSVTMSGNTATIVFAGPIPTTSTWQSGQSIIMAGFTPSGLNGTFTIASVVNTTTITVSIGSNPGNGTVMGTAVTATTDCSYPGFTAIIDKLHSSGIKVLPVAEVFTGAGAASGGSVSLPLAIASGGTGQTSAAAAITALTGTQSSGKVLRSDGTNATLANIQAADIPTLNQNTSGTAAGLSATLAIGSGGTGQVTQQAAIDALTGTQSAGKVLRSDGTHATLASLVAGDLPAATTSAQGAVQLDGTAADIIADSTQAAVAGSTGKAPDAGHAHPATTFKASDHGLITWAFDPAVSVSTSSVLATAGTMYVVRLHMPVAASVTKIELHLVTAGSGLSSGCIAALYQGGSLLGQTADQSAAWAGTGQQHIAITGGPVNVAAGDVFVGMWFTGTTGPAPLRGNSSAAVNFNLAASVTRWGTANTGLSGTTTAPSTLGSLTTLTTAYWAALS
jgi:hypothetical protein